MKTALLSLLAGGLLAPCAVADLVEVTVTGEVGFSVIGGDHSGVSPGDPVVMRFVLDSAEFADSPNFPTRGYTIDPATFEMSVGGAAVVLEDPQPFGPAYFVIRDNDPAVDGFLISRNIDVPLPVQVDIPGLAPTHDLDFLVTYPETQVSSLDLLDALALGTLVAFWPTYFSIFREAPAHAHARCRMPPRKQLLWRSRRDRRLGRKFRVVEAS